MTIEKFFKIIEEDDEYEIEDYIILSSCEIITPDENVLEYDDFDELLEYVLPSGRTIKEVIEDQEMREIVFEWNIKEEKKKFRDFFERIRKNYKA